MKIIVSFTLCLCAGVAVSQEDSTPHRQQIDESNVADNSPCIRKIQLASARVLEPGEYVTPLSDYSNNGYFGE